MNHLINITKSDGTTELFEEEKLINSLKRVGATQEAIDSIVETVGKSMKSGMTTAKIYHHAFSLLKTHSLPIAVKYSVRRALMELGPDGFPFEKFVARIFRKWGYQTLTDQTVMGKCVPHEMDVVAWKGKTLAMVEAKFHNENVLSSDIKVVLYIKARFDDIAETTFDYGNGQCKLAERWLITNTKFTDRAIHYGVCERLNLLGWNYPVKDSLHEIIEKTGLQPITCLTTLNHQQKKDIIGRGMLACADIIEAPESLREIGIKPENIEAIVNEAKLIIGSAK